MKRHAKIVTAFLVIVALMVDSVGACLLFRRARFRTGWTSCYTPPMVYDPCMSPGGPMGPGYFDYNEGSEALPSQPTPGGEGTTIMSPSMRMPWPQLQSGQPERRQPTPAEPPSTFRSTERTAPDTDAPRTTPERSERRTEPMPEPRIEPMAEPMPERRTEPSRTEAAPFENPFDQPRRSEPPVVTPEATTPTNDTRPMPTTDPDDPFAPRTTPRTMPPAESAAPADDPFGRREPAAGARAPADDPFGARPATQEPATKAPMDDPFAPRTNQPQASETRTPPATDAIETPASTTAADDPFAPKVNETKAPLDDPFALPRDAARAPVSEVKDEPMSDATEPAKPATPTDNEKKESNLDDPFAEPVGPKLSNAEPAEPADAMRVWIDVTGKHRIRGRMNRIIIAEGKVRILKETGKYTTVPLAKLSQADQTFVAVHSREPSMLLAEKR